MTARAKPRAGVLILMLVVVGGLFVAALRMASENERNPPPDEPFILGPDAAIDLLPKATKKVAPVYPRAARQAGIEGKVLVQVLVGQDGKVKDTRIVKSIPGLDEAAEEAARRWEFEPAQTDGEPAPIWVAIPIKFSLSE